jgi:CRP/FNR family transcriptional regulator, cyclic AMP receptor protein
MPAPPTCEKTTIRQLLAQVRFLRDASPAVIDALAAAAVCLRYAEGATIFLEGEPTAGLFVVEEGMVKISRVSLEGREYIMHLVEPGNTFNDVSTLDGGPNPAHATAHTDVVLWRIDRADLRRLARAYPDLAWALIEDLAARARVAVGLVHDLAMRSVRGRLARLLLEEAESRDTDIVQRLLTQEEMAARLGTVREMVGRTLRSMANDGLIQFDRHRIVILDAQRLAEEAEI